MESKIKVVPTYGTVKRDGFFELKELSIFLDVYQWQTLMDALVVAGRKSDEFFFIRECVMLHEALDVKRYRRDAE